MSVVTATGCAIPRRRSSRSAPCFGGASGRIEHVAAEEYLVRIPQGGDTRGDVHTAALIAGRRLERLCDMQTDPHRRREAVLATVLMEPMPRDFHALMDEMPEVRLKVLCELARRVRALEPDAGH